MCDTNPDQLQGGHEEFCLNTLFNAACGKAGEESAACSLHVFDPFPLGSLNRHRCYSVAEILDKRDTATQVRDVVGHNGRTKLGTTVRIQTPGSPNAEEMRVKLQVESQFFL